MNKNVAQLAHDTGATPQGILEAGGIFKIVFNVDDDLNVTADKTYEQTKNAIESGSFVYGVATVPGLGVGTVICGGIVGDGVIHFTSFGMEVAGDNKSMLLIWFNYNPDGTFDYDMENPPYSSD